MTKREYVSMRGKKIDLELLKKMNELVPAVGNARVNARGDEIGPGGQIIKNRNDIIKDYYKTNPNQVVTEPNKRPVVSESVVNNKPFVENESVVNSDWTEDDSGNFVKKEKTPRKPKTD
jgi:hypothetical protein